MLSCSLPFREEARSLGTEITGWERAFQRWRWGEGDNELFLTFDLFFKLAFSCLRGLSRPKLPPLTAASATWYIPVSEPSGFLLHPQFSWSPCPLLPRPPKPEVHTPGPVTSNFPALGRPLLLRTGVTIGQRVPSGAWLSLQSCGHELSGNQSKTTSQWSTGQNRAGCWGRHRISLCWVTARGSSNTTSRGPAHPLPQAPHPSTTPHTCPTFQPAPRLWASLASQERLNTPRGEGRARQHQGAFPADHTRLPFPFLLALGTRHGQSPGLVPLCLIHCLGSANNQACFSIFRPLCPAYPL